MASIGAISCTFLKGSLPQVRRMRSRTWHRPGINGRGLLQLGYDGVEVELVAIYYGGDAAVKSWATLVHALQATIVVVINDRGHAASVFLEEVGNCTTRVARDGSVTTRGEIRIRGVAWP